MTPFCAQSRVNLTSCHFLIATHFHAVYAHRRANWSSFAPVLVRAFGNARVAAQERVLPPHRTWLDRLARHDILYFMFIEQSISYFQFVTRALWDNTSRLVPFQSIPGYRVSRSSSFCSFDVILFKLSLFSCSCDSIHSVLNRA